MSISVQVWDMPLRLFHWLLALSVIAAIVTGELGGNLIDWHGRIGVLIAGLLVFRIVWGFLGTTHARFASFVPTPARIAAYLKGEWQQPGHNPLGALSVFALLGALAALAGLGLFANDDIAFSGPLAGLVDKSLSDKLSGWHARLFYLLALLLVLHIAAIIFYARVKRKNLVLPMLTGKSEVPADAPAINGGGAVRFTVALAIALAVGWGANGGLLATQPQASAAKPPAATPNW